VSFFWIESDFAGYLECVHFCEMCEMELGVLPERWVSFCWVVCLLHTCLNSTTPRTTFLNFPHRKYPPLVEEGHVLSRTAWGEKNTTVRHTHTHTHRLTK